MDLLQDMSNLILKTTVTGATGTIDVTNRGAGSGGLTGRCMGMAGKPMPMLCCK